MLIPALSLAAALTVLPPAHAGQCVWVHGRFAIYNGSGVRRIWVIGTHRLIALHDDDQNVPPAIQAYETQDSNFGLEDALFGDFYVCALERSRPGYMQFVRMTATRHLIWRSKGFDGRHGVSGRPVPTYY